MMSEIERKARTIIVNYACDDCSKKPNPGCVLKPTGFVFTVNPPLFEHECPNCNKLYKLKERYPVIRYEMVDEND